MASELVDSPSPEPGKVVGIVISFPATDSPSASLPAKIPRRGWQRLSECKPPLSAEVIEAKLRGADVRRHVKFLDFAFSRFLFTFELNFVAFPFLHPFID